MPHIGVVMGWTGKVVCTACCEPWENPCFCERGYGASAIELYKFHSHALLTAFLKGEQQKEGGGYEACEGKLLEILTKV